MNDRQEHREVSSGRASLEGRRRLSGALRREVGDLEIRLEEAELRSAAFEEAGLHSEAARVLQESRELVQDFHQRLNSALAQAAVEREAERILASSDDVIDVLVDEQTSGGVLARIPAGIGAAVASIAVLAMAALTLRAPAERDTRPASDVAALTEDADDAPSVEATSAATERLILSLPAVDQAVLGESVGVDPEVVAPLLSKRRALLASLRSTPEAVTTAVLAELDALVEQLRDEGVDVDRLMELERMSEQDAPEQAETADQPEPEPQPEAPTEEPEPTTTDEPSEDASEDDGDGGVFGGFDDDEPEDDQTEGDEPEAGAQGQSEGDKGESDEGIIGDW